MSERRRLYAGALGRGSEYVLNAIGNGGYRTAPAIWKNGYPRDPAVWATESQISDDQGLVDQELRKLQSRYELATGPHLDVRKELREALDALSLLDTMRKVAPLSATELNEILKAVAALLVPE
jgi:hypothetical protein